MHVPSLAYALLFAALLSGCQPHTGAPFRQGTPDPHVTRCPAETEAVRRGLDQLRACQLPDGAFTMAPPQADPQSRIWIAPYFGQFAALALLAGPARQPDTQDLLRVRRWLDWCVAHQSADGIWHDYAGTASAYTDTGRVDAWDSSAALFLVVAERFRHAGGEVTPSDLMAARRSLACLNALADADGLTWAKPDYRVKFLMDNIEVQAGLRAANRLFGDSAEGVQARESAARLTTQLASFWRAADGCYAYALQADGRFAGGLLQPYPHGLAQLYALSFVAPRADVWTATCRAFQPETGPSAACGTAWWACAATRFGAEEARVWRGRVATEALAFDPSRVYLHRYALSVLALLEGANWLVPAR